MKNRGLAQDYTVRKDRAEFAPRFVDLQSVSDALPSLAS